jgi:hypothetical protein
MRSPIPNSMNTGCVFQYAWYTRANSALSETIDLGSSSDCGAILTADVTDRPWVPEQPPNFVRVFASKKFNLSTVDYQPKLDLHQVAGLLVGAEPLHVAL